MNQKSSVELKEDVQGFAALLQRELTRKEQKYGPDKIWRESSLDGLFLHLSEEVGELARALRAEAHGNAIEEAVHVGLLALMITDRLLREPV